MTLLKLFLSFFQVGMFSVGGGYAAMPLIQNQVVDTYGWLSMQEFTDLVTFAEMTPGPIVINGATYVGLRIAGIPGAIIATFASILPSLIIMSVIYTVYAKSKNIQGFQNVLGCLRPVVVALIASAGISILKVVILVEKEISFANINWLGVLLFAMAFIAIKKFKVNPILAMFCCGIINLICGLSI